MEATGHSQPSPEKSEAQTTEVVPGVTTHLQCQCLTEPHIQMQQSKNFPLRVLVENVSE